MNIMRSIRAITSSSNGHWLASFFASTLFFVRLVLAIVWIMEGFGDGSISTQGWIAMTLGTLLMIGLGVGLRALVFFSDHSGHDDV